MSQMGRELIKDALRNPAVTILYRQQLDSLMCLWTLEPDVVKMVVPIHTGLYSGPEGTRTYQSMMVEEEACCSPNHELCTTRTYKFSTLLARLVRKLQDEQFNPREARKIALNTALTYAEQQLEGFEWNEKIKRFISKDITKKDLLEMKRMHSVLAECDRLGIECNPLDLDSACGRVIGDANRRILKEIGMEDIDFTNPMELDIAEKRNYAMEYARTSDSGEYVDGLHHESNVEGYGEGYFRNAFGKLWFRLQRVCKDATVDDIDRVQCFTSEMKLPHPEGFYSYSGVLARDQDFLDSDAVARAFQYGMTPYVGMDMRANSNRLNFKTFSSEREREVEVIGPDGNLVQATTNANPPQAYRTLISHHIRDFLGLQHVVYGILHDVSESELAKDVERSELLRQLNPSVISVTKLIKSYLGNGEFVVRSRFLIQRPVNYYKREMTIKSETAADFWLLIPLDDLGDYLTPGWKSTDDPTRTTWIGFRIGGLSERGSAYGSMFKKLIKSRTNLSEEYTKQVLNAWVKFLKAGGKLNSKVYTEEPQPKPTGSITPAEVMEFWNEECPSWRGVIRDVKPKRWACWCPTCVSLRG